MSALLIVPAESQNQAEYVETALDPGYVEAIFRDSSGGGSIIQVRGCWWKLRVPFSVMIRAYSMSKDDISSGFMTTYTPTEVNDKWEVLVEKTLKGD